MYSKNSAGGNILAQFTMKICKNFIFFGLKNKNNREPWFEQSFRNVFQ